MNRWELANCRPHVQEFLESRGFVWLEQNKPCQVLHSRTSIGLRESKIDACYNSYTFRRLLKLLTTKRSEGPFSESFLAQKTGCSNGEKLREYLDILLLEGLVEQQGNSWAIHPEVAADNDGPTMEWYVAQKFAEKLHWSATPSVCLDGLPCNDYDVIAVRGSEMMCVECKCTEPDRIEPREVEAFHERHQFLAPKLSLLLVDSSKPIDSLAARVSKAFYNDRDNPPLKDTGGGRMFFIFPNVYVADTRTDNRSDGILTSLQDCLRHHYTNYRPVAAIG